MPTYTYDEVKQHNDNGECWLIINEQVYDVTSFTDHPGGHDKLVSAAARGGDATRAFEGVRAHRSDRARRQMARYYKGDIDMTTVPVSSSYTPNVVRDCSDQLSILHKAIRRITSR